MHPDFFTNAPPEVLKANQESVQAMNEYFQSLRAFGNKRGVQAVKLTFFIREGERVSQKEKYSKVKVKLLDLKDGCSVDLKQSHYSKAIETLTKALYKTLDRLDELKSAEGEDDIFNQVKEEGGYEFKMRSEIAEEHLYEPPTKSSGLIDRLERQLRQDKLSQYASNRYKKA